MSLANHLIAALLIVASAISLVSVTSFTSYPEVINYGDIGIRVSYTPQNQLINPSIIVTYSSLSPTEGVTMDSYLWLPNGSFAYLGRSYGTASATEISLGSLLKAIEPWRELYGNKPGLSGVDVGVITLSTVLRSDGVYASVAVIPVNLDKVLKGYSVNAVIAQKPVRVISDDEVRKDLASAAQTKAAQSGDFPPPTIINNCYRVCYGPHLCYNVCYEWRMCNSTDPYVGLNTRIPLVATVIKGGAYDKVYYTYLREFLQARASASVSVGFAAVAGVSSGSSGGGISYQIAGYTWVAHTTTWANLSYSKGFMPGVDYSSPNTVLYVGFRGDISVARYRLYKCYHIYEPPSVDCIPLDKWANITVARPVNGAPLNNSIAVWGKASLYNYADPVTRQYIGLVSNGWLTYDDERVANDNVTLTSHIVKDELNTLLSLSGGVNVLSLILPQPLGSLAPIMAVSVGVTVQREDVEFMLLEAHTRLKPDNSAEWSYAKSPTEYSYGGNYYKIGMVYVRVT